MVKTLIPVFTCAYCGNTRMKKGDAECAYCGSSLDWENAVTEPDPVVPFPAWPGKGAGTIEAREMPGNAGLVIVPAPSFSIDWNREMVEKAKENIDHVDVAGGKDQKTAYRDAIRKAYAERMRKAYNVKEIVILGISKPYSMAKRPGYAEKFPERKDYFTSRIVWMLADGKDLNVRMSWLWLKNEDEIQKYVKCLFKVCEVDVAESVSGGKLHWNIARHALRPKCDLTLDEIGTIMAKIKNQTGIKIDGIADEEVCRSQDYDLGGCWKTAEATCLYASDLSFGKSVKLVDPFGEKTAFAFSPSFLNNDVKPGDTVIVTGYVYKARAFNKETKKLEADVTENRLDITGLKVIDRAETIEGIADFIFSEKVDGSNARWDLASGSVKN